MRVQVHLPLYYFKSTPLPSFVFNSFSAQLSVIIRRPLVTNVVAQPTAQIYILKFFIPDKMVTNFREFFVLVLHL